MDLLRIASIAKNILLGLCPKPAEKYFANESKSHFTSWFYPKNKPLY